MNMAEHCRRCQFYRDLCPASSYGGTPALLEGKSIRQDLRCRKNMPITITTSPLKRNRPKD